ncbi:ribonuclease J [Poseidonibacter sp. 1_MG-2023]|uniref:ribonuclease J n=1 Tax=Poseidonibacter TaxID=2321187 RepID=UPI001E3BD837|nr:MULTISPECIES: ribonuclease J [Poseidonibacter]MDO6827609.1 ribonuclease J [Poseidonibacter sp. 1_MG-2023]
MEEIKKEEIKQENTTVKTETEAVAKPAINTPAEQTKNNTQEVKPTSEKVQRANPNQNRKPNPNKRSKAKIPTEMSGDGWMNDLKKGHLVNEKIQKDRLNPHYKLNLNTSAKMRITPLGGLGEIGGNMMIIETEKSAIIVDVGMNFPDETMHGVDILIPDFTYLREIKHKIEAVIITHGHEDHIGAMPYLFKEMQFPIYGTSLPLEMIGSKFDEHKMREFRKFFRCIEKRKPIKIGEFEVEWMHVTHSIIDSSAIAVTTEAGTMIHTGDFKIDHTPIDGYPTDLHRLAYYGEKGVLLLTSDSTNSHSPGFTRTEKTVGPTFDRIFAGAKGRVIMSTFSSNIHRVSQAIDRGIASGRKVCVIGRSMEKNLDLAMGLGYVKFPKDSFIDAHEVNKYKDNEVLIVTTGSQGEPMSALYRMAIHEHRHIKIKPTDQIVLSAKAIPGNEASVSGILNNLLKAGAKVAYQDYPDIHVSGHAAQEEQKLMLRLVKPKFFMPVHGEYNHALKHGKTGIDCGVLERNLYIMNAGEQIEVTPKYMKKIKTVKSGKVYIDNQLNHKISDDIVIDRQTMANEGVVMIVAQINENDRTLADRAKVTSFGLVPDKQDKFFAKEIEDLLATFLANAKPGIFKNSRMLEDELRKVVRKHCIRKYKKYPMIVPTIFVQ